MKCKVPLGLHACNRGERYITCPSFHFISFHNPARFSLCAPIVQLITWLQGVVKQSSCICHALTITGYAHRSMTGLQPVRGKSSVKGKMCNINCQLSHSWMLISSWLVLIMWTFKHSLSLIKITHNQSRLWQLAPFHRQSGSSWESCAHAIYTWQLSLSKLSHHSSICCYVVVSL